MSTFSSNMQYSEAITTRIKFDEQQDKQVWMDVVYKQILAPENFKWVYEYNTEHNFSIRFDKNEAKEEYDTTDLFHSDQPVGISYLVLLGVHIHIIYLKDHNF